MGHTTDKIVQTMSRALADEKLLTLGGGGGGGENQCSNYVSNKSN